MYIIWAFNTGENVSNVNEVEGGRSKKQGNIYKFKNVYLKKILHEIVILFF